MDEFLKQAWRANKIYTNAAASVPFYPDLLALLLVCDEKNLDQFMALDEFRAVLKKLKIELDIFSIQSAQLATLKALNEAKISSEEIVKYLEKLRDEKIIDDEKFAFLEKIISKNKGANEAKISHTKPKDHFHKNLDFLNEINEKASLLDSDKTFLEALMAAKKRSNETLFNIAASGVINSGKSTLLNALLNKPVLGASNVPETINLTILKYSKDSFARVNFYTLDELLALGIPSENLPSKSVDIGIDEIKNYTSSSSKTANLVKSVELYDDLELLKDNVCIIDTPGIDDAVVLREQITTNFMKKCDLLAHLMNASQSATQKDALFLKKCLENSHIVRLAVVLTHADELSAKELNETLNYTKKAIGEQINDIKIDYFALSAKAYLDGALNSGVPEFKEYLYDVLFGKDSKKSALILSSYRKELQNILKIKLEATKAEILELKAFGLELEALQNEQANIKNSLNENFTKLERLLESELKKLDDKNAKDIYKMGLEALLQNLNEKLKSEIAYCKSKRENLNLKRLTQITKTTLCDGVAALMREARNETLVQTKSCEQNIALSFDGFKVSENKIFSINDFLKQMGVELDFSALLDELEAKILSKSEPDEALLSLRQNLLNNKSISQFCEMLAEHEKKLLKERVKAYEMSQKEALNKRLLVLNEKLNELNLQNQNSISKLNQKTSLQDEIYSLLEDIKNV
ncbi:dynamin family protein [Campylobacter concisus]|uniref:dynamin family protein n=1 Tax=Campylobacter concisus TaxID=199 RepID=UPI0011E6CA33|nr:dynamin family protein [Campylobacter concisus]